MWQNKYSKCKQQYFSTVVLLFYNNCNFFLSRVINTFSEYFLHELMMQKKCQRVITFFNFLQLFKLLGVITSSQHPDIFRNFFDANNIYEICLADDGWLNGIKALDEKYRDCCFMALASPKLFLAQRPIIYYWLHWPVNNLKLL